MKNRIIIFLFMFLILGIDNVSADYPDCHAELDGFSTKMAVGEEFIYNVGTMGAASNGYINGIHYVIEYDNSKLEVVSINDRVAAAYNGWEVSAVNDTSTGLRVNKIVLDATTTDKSKMYHSISVEKFVKIAYIKFRVKNTEETSTNIELIGDGSYHRAYIENDEDFDFKCNGTDNTVVNIYKKNTDTSLSSLNVNQGELDPKFNPQTASYEVTVDNEVNVIQIDGTCSGTNCSIDGIGLKELKVGENRYTISVKSENGNEKTYAVSVTRREKDEAYLTKLSIGDYDLLPDFNSNFNNYVVNVPYEVKKLDLKYMSNDDENNIVEVLGNKDFKVGQNEVIITVKNKEKDIESNYNLLVIKADKVEEVKKSFFDFKTIAIIILSLISIVEALVIIFKVRRRR